MSVYPQIIDLCANEQALLRIIKDYLFMFPRRVATKKQSNYRKQKNGGGGIESWSLAN